MGPSNPPSPPPPEGVDGSRSGVGAKNFFLVGSKVVAAKWRGTDNMSPGSNELMFGNKEQVPDEGQSDYEREPLQERASAMNNLEYS